MSLADETCLPCRGGVAPLTAAEIAPLAAQLPGWAVVNAHHLRREYTFPDFTTALAFVDAIGAEAEAQGHHPDLELRWGFVGITLCTHKIDGLAQADFVLAAKIDRIAAGAAPSHAAKPTNPPLPKGLA
jgi:4a-hydroxytetrahydrobiopterin dehydratase